MMKIFIAGPSTTTLPGRQSCAVERYGSLSREVVRWTTTRQALLRMLLLSQTWTILQYALVVATVFGREGVIIAHAKVRTTSVPARAMKGISGNA